MSTRASCGGLTRADRVASNGGLVPASHRRPMLVLPTELIKFKGVVKALEENLNGVDDPCAAIVKGSDVLPTQRALHSFDSRDRGRLVVT